MLHVFTLIAKHYEDVEKNTTIKTWKFFFGLIKLNLCLYKVSKYQGSYFIPVVKYINIEQNRTEHRCT